MYKIQYCILNVEVYLNYECLNTPRNNSMDIHTLAERKECMCVREREREREREEGKRERER